MILWTRWKKCGAFQNQFYEPTLAEAIAQIFQKLEEESERRAQEELAREAAESHHDKPALTKAQRERQRRRGSISISRIGKVPSVN